MKLHLGCGHRRLPGFVHVDNRPQCRPDELCDVGRLDEFDNNSVDLIYASHVLEHVARPLLMDTLAEWRRVLKPGGRVRIAVPDFRVLAKMYVKQRVPMWRIVGALYGRQNYESNTHYVAFDYDYLAWHLTEAGFYDVTFWHPAVELPEDYDDYSLAQIDNQLISLCVEATAS